MSRYAECGAFAGNGCALRSFHRGGGLGCRTLLAVTHVPAWRRTMRGNDSSALARSRRSSRRGASAVGLSAAGLILVAACVSCGTSAHGGSASAPLTPRQALLAAATQAQQVTSG